jgi:nucleoside-diphosphate-sugar epimerase
VNATRILVLGGTQFVGRHVVEAALARALAARLRIRPLEEIARHTLEWARAGLAPSAPEAGLERVKERDVLDARLSKR